MRNRPVERDEVYIAYYRKHYHMRDAIFSVPLDACREVECKVYKLDKQGNGFSVPGVKYVPIEGLFVELVAEAELFPSYNRSHDPCVYCGKPFGWAERHWRRFCSNVCSKKARHAAEVARRARRREDARFNRVCEYCGTLLRAERSSKKFCSPKCRVAAHRASKSEAAQVAGSDQPS